MQVIGYLTDDGIITSPLLLEAAFKIEQKPVDPIPSPSSERVMRVFSAVPDEAVLRYPATRSADGSWVAGTVDPADPKLVSSFRLDDAPDHDDGVYRNPNVNHTGPLIKVFRVSVG